MGRNVRGYNFTERVRAVLTLAREEAAWLGHEYVGTEHQLLGLIDQVEGVAAAVLTNLDIDGEVVSDSVRRMVRAGPRSTRWPYLPYTSRAKHVLELAMAESRELGHSYIGTEHLLLGLLREGTGIAAQVLAEMGVTERSVRTETLRLLGQEAPPETAAIARDERASTTPAGADRVRTDVATAGTMTLESPSALVDALLTAPAEDVGFGATESLRSMLAGAQARSRASGGGRVRAEHLLVELLSLADGAAAVILDRLDVRRERLRELAERPRSDAVEDVGWDPGRDHAVLTAGAHRVLHLACLEATENEELRVGTEHVLIALGIYYAGDPAFAEAGLSTARARERRERIRG